MSDHSHMQDISLGYFRSLFPDAPSVGLGDDFFIIDAKLTDRHNPLSHPCRFDGFMLIYCVSGRVKLNVNLEEYELNENMLLLYLPGNFICINELVDTKQEDMHYVCMAISREFVSGMMLDVNKIFTENITLIKNPCLLMREQDKQRLCSHISLMVDIVKSSDRYRVQSVQSVLLSVFYLLAGIWVSHIDEEGVVSKKAGSRSKMIFDQFIKLVAEHYPLHRNVTFYADKLGLSPKYLSSVIKNTSGRSAPEWIDAYVILEAKNQLKYSGKTIKEIITKLNFQNQSVFYKFFKAKTGMTPSEYKNS